MARVVLAGISAGDFGRRCRVVAWGQTRSFRVIGGRGVRGGPAEIGGIVSISGRVAVEGRAGGT